MATVEELERKPVGRVTWHGTLTFGMVSVPVGLTVAQERREISYVQLHRGCGERIKMPKSCPKHGALTVDDIQKGYEHEKGEYVPVDEDVLDSLGPIGGKSIKIERFVPVDSVDPIHFDRTYYLTASKEEPERVGYKLLLEAMRQTEMAAVARFVLWGKSNLCLVRPAASGEDVLVLDTLFYHEDVRDPESIVAKVERVPVNDDELDMAVQIIGSLSTDSFVVSDYPNTHRPEVRKYLAELVKGKKPKARKAATPKAPTTDLMGALRASMKDVKAARSQKPTKSTSRGQAVRAKAAAARAKK